ncbi:putative Melatonin receptor type 1C [Hypsibius exemplaris]|uniref:Melatonin receptor type 1C n=1 Tax=Hypsibius exemplaris TaxID=2072580 RepID=A0A1W0XEI7_HYPEX|nr:putative Melatonin receptor type 1C [Hypsibius exemplaris]
MREKDTGTHTKVTQYTLITFDAATVREHRPEQVVNCQLLTFVNGHADGNMERLQLPPIRWNVSDLQRLLPNLTGNENGMVNGSVNGTTTMTDLATTHPLLYLRTHFTLMVVLVFVLISSTVVGTIGNLLVILTLTLVQSLRSVGNMFILNLALADLVISTTVVPFNAVGALNGEVAFLNDNMLCNVIGSVCAPACMSSMWNMCVISLNRYILICYPHLYKQLFTPWSTFFICFMIWFLCHMAHIPNHVGWGKISWNPDFYLCTFDVLDTHSYAIFYVFLGVLLPLVGVLYGYVSIFFKVRAVKISVRQHRRGAVLEKVEKHGSTSTKSKRPVQTQVAGFTREDIRLAKTLFVAFAVFFLCWLPFALLVLFGQPRIIPKWIYVVAMFMAHGNSAMNPIIYGMSNKKFREGYRRVAKCSPNTVSSGAEGSSLAPKKHETLSNSKQRMHPSLSVNASFRNASLNPAE